jgi:hypothetical protein
MSAMIVRSRSIGELAFVLAGPMVWAAHFFLLYGAEVLICTGPVAGSRGEQLLPVAAALTTAAVAGLLAILVAGLTSGRQARQATEGTTRSLFWRDAPTALAMLAMLGVLWTALPALLIPACAPPAA